MDFMDLNVSTLELVVWSIIAVAALFAELETCTFSFAWFFISALVSLMLAFFGFSPLIQVVSFVVVSCFFFFVIGKFFIKSKPRNVIHTNIDAYIGKEVEIQEIIEKNKYEVKLEGKIWTASSTDELSFSKGDKVKIIEVTGNRLIIK